MFRRYRKGQVPAVPDGELLAHALPARSGRDPTRGWHAREIVPGSVWISLGEGLDVHRKRHLESLWLARYSRRSRRRPRRELDGGDGTPTW
jgi:hypothetical protein